MKGKSTEILDAEIQDEIAEFISQEVEKHVAEMADTFKKKVKKAKKEADDMIKESRESIRKEYSIKFLERVGAAERKVQKLEEEKEEWKLALTEKVNKFLVNSKQEIRNLMEEENRLDPDNMSAASKLDEVRRVLGDVPTAPIVESSAIPQKVDVLISENKILKERSEKQRNTNKKLKAKVRMYELVESVSPKDRSFYLERLDSAETVEECDALFAKAKADIKRKRITRNVNESRVEKGSAVFDHVAQPKREDKNPFISEKTRFLAGVTN